jgi:hypothetical protein
MPRKKAEQETAVVAYKAFNPDFTCKGHKFEVGQAYEVKGKVRACHNGFHACENPFDVLGCYDLVNADGAIARFAKVTLAGEIDRDGDKICGGKITVKAELGLPAFIKAGIDWLVAACKSGDNVQSASGDYSKLAASGDYSKLAASGYNSQLAASGYYSKLAASGYNSQLAASGYNSQLAASGYNSQLAASGYNSQLAASGYNSQLAASGYNSKLAASGNYSQLAASGANSAVAAVGPGSLVKAAAGTPIAICEYSDGGKPLSFATGIAGKDFPADTWVIARDGKLVEAV